MRLTVHPQRSVVMVTVMVLSTLFTLGGIGLMAARPFTGWMLMVGIPLILAVFFTYAVFRRVELERRPGELMLTWIGWPYKIRSRVLKLDDLRDIIVEEDDGGYRVVFLLPDECVPLTGSYTGNNLEPLVLRLKQFVGIDA